MLAVFRCAMPPKFHMLAAVGMGVVLALCTQATCLPAPGSFMRLALAALLHISTAAVMLLGLFDLTHPVNIGPCIVACVLALSSAGHFAIIRNVSVVLAGILMAFEVVFTPILVVCLCEHSAIEGLAEELAVLALSSACLLTRRFESWFVFGVRRSSRLLTV